MIKDTVVDWVDGKISDEQFVREVGKKGLMLAVDSVGAFVGAVIGSVVTMVACNGVIFAVDATLRLLDASKVNAASCKNISLTKNYNGIKTFKQVLS